jgi:hypothetical protein
VTTDKDPQVDIPGTPDPGPGTEKSSKPGRDSPGSSASGASQGERDEANEPLENRFPSDDTGEQRESG